jgi:eukaryotic-like serine/threonine-protein kinase
VRSRIERDDRRKSSPGTGMAGFARDEDTEFSASEPARPGMAWVIAAAIAAVVAVGGILSALLVAGVI